MSPHSAPRSWPLRLAPLLACGLLLGAELVVAARSHRSTEELLRQAAAGEGRERVLALHVLCNRGSKPTPQLDAAYMRGLMRDEDPLVVDFTFTVDMCRVIRPVWQEKRLGTWLSDPTADYPWTFAESWRRWILYRRKVGGAPLGAALRLKNQEVRWLLDSIAGRPLDEAAMHEHVQRREAESSAQRLHRLAPNRRRRDGERLPNPIGPPDDARGKRP